MCQRQNEKHTNIYTHTHTHMKCKLIVTYHAPRNALKSYVNLNYFDITTINNSDFNILEKLIT